MYHSDEGASRYNVARRNSEALELSKALEEVESVPLRPATLSVSREAFVGKDDVCARWMLDFEDTGVHVNSFFPRHVRLRYQR
ncbi:hypothetical protein PsorP6_011928 [Peronosclerospora sorghi]|uniref:Uncharacterized protein n=1 Tax=Peronosclerospora sorghi TaxID=230839 RepID=A0ACC0WM62_9STRA|nr:hypothetical protein PsorP6_011928 [Peronosclerospora sorghi]